MKNSTHRAFRAPNNLFCWRALHFSEQIERRFFDVDSIDANASIDRGARKRSQLFFLEEIERRFFDAESTEADASIDRGARKRSKIVKKHHSVCYMFAYSTNKIDASRFSWPEQCFVGAPLISLKKSNVLLSMSIRSMPMPLDRGARKRLKITLRC